MPWTSDQMIWFELMLMSLIALCCCSKTVNSRSGGFVKMAITRPLWPKWFLEKKTGHFVIHLRRFQDFEIESYVLLETESSLFHSLSWVLVNSSYGQPPISFHQGGGQYAIHILSFLGLQKLRETRQQGWFALTQWSEGQGMYESFTIR